MTLQFAAVLDRPTVAAAQLLGLAVLSGGLSAAVALLYRWYTRERVQRGLPVLVGLAGVAVSFNTTAILGQVLAGGTAPLSPETAVFNVAAFLLAGFTAAGGVDVGDRLGNDLFAATGSRSVEGEVSRVVEAVGRVIAVELPEEIDDIVGYDPVPDETKAQLAGRTFLFPRRLTVADLEDRLRTRLKSDYGVGHVDVDVAADGSVEFLALGARVAGIGPTLPPETAAVVIRADPAFAASAGDVVQVWRRDPVERVTTAEVRGVAGDAVTLAVDAADTEVLDADTEYRLVTLPTEARLDREFASLLRGAEETMSVVELDATSPLVGQPVGSLDVAVMAVRLADGGIEAIPGRGHVLAAGDAVYAVARPELLRKLEVAAAVADPAAARAASSESDD
ncbi:TrkA C-terminal domain-containing protein [Halorientalis halophila]|uniref:TrkA C-terminal domain-containing protein n=1 Tax=Halorientalis halophila TaxID=3108499 RepID=UPI003009DFF2